MEIHAIALALVVSVVGVAVFARGVGSIVGVIRLGRPVVGRRDQAGRRWRHLLAETLGHTRMLQWNTIGVAHWFVFVAFGALFFTLITAYGQLFDPRFALPIIGHWVVYEWASEIIAWAGLIAIVFLMIIRALLRGRGRYSRFFGSRTWQAVYVELTILGIVVCVIVLRGLEYQLLGAETSRQHFPLTWFVIPDGISADALAMAVVIVAAVKIIISMAWFITIGLNTTMGVAWHRFTVWPNIWFKRESSGRPALGALAPIMVGGQPIDFAAIEDLDEDASLGVGQVEDFTWKGLLDFTSCTECGRCQSQCPAWNTEKPLSPKLLIMELREHAYAKAPYLQAAEEIRGEVAEAAQREAGRPLVGPDPGEQRGGRGHRSRRALVLHHLRGVRAAVPGGHRARRPHPGYAPLPGDDGLGVSLGAERAVQRPGEQGKSLVDEPARPDGLGKDLGFDVPVVGEDVEDLSEVDYLFWVGCAGAYDDRAKKTSRAVAELLNTAGVRYAVLGNGETCTGDPARRAGNEFVFAQLAMENVETLTEAKATKIVTACAHCLNTLKNEYPQFGTSFEVVHHTQLLNQLVRDGRLTPVAPPEGSVAGRTITFHDPCYLGRHNEVYDPPRELLGALPGATVAEMPRNRERSFCCGAGGARMWMEEKIGTRINNNRTEEALSTLQAAGGHAENQAIATGCPFCRVMLSDGLTAKQADGTAPATTEVIDVAQLLLESVRRGG